MTGKEKNVPSNLVAWRLASALRREVLRLMAQSPAATNVRFRSQGEDAPSSTCRNLAEGYKRFQPGEFANFARYSATSNAEVGDVLEDGVNRRYWSAESSAAARTLVERTAGAIGRLQRYLRSPRARRNAQAILQAHTESRPPKKPEK